ARASQLRASPGKGAAETPAARASPRASGSSASTRRKDGGSAGASAPPPQNQTLFTLAAPRASRAAFTGCSCSSICASFMSARKRRGSGGPWRSASPEPEAARKSRRRHAANRARRHGSASDSSVAPRLRPPFPCGKLPPVQYELFVGLRYTRAKRRNHFISFISLISMAGIALGVAALIVVLSVMNGFQKELRAPILGLASPLQIRSTTNRLVDWSAVAQAP